MGELRWKEAGPSCLGGAKCHLLGQSQTSVAPKLQRASEPLEGLLQCRLPGPTESLTHLGWDQGISFPESSQGCYWARKHILRATVLFKSDLQASLLQGLCCG